MESEDKSKKLNKALLIASLLNLVGLILLLLSLFKLTPVTLMLSIGAGGFLIATAFLLYVYSVVQDLRMRKIL